MNSDSLKKILLLLPSFNLYIFLLLYYSNLTLINSVGIPHKCELGWSISGAGTVHWSVWWCTDAWALWSKSTEFLHSYLNISTGTQEVVCS